MTPVVGYGTRSISFILEHRDVARFQITVDPFGAVRVRAPNDASAEETTAAVRRRARWIIRQQRYFAQFRPRTPARRWVPGETHLYLGRQHLLRIGDAAASAPAVIRTRGVLTVDGCRRDDAVAIEHAVLAWYRSRAEDVVRDRLDVIHATSGLPRPERIQIRRMTTRWASMSVGGVLSVNPLLMRAPRDGVDYVLVHELCHRLHPNHGAGFVELLTQVMPDWRVRKQRLERTLA